MSSDPQTLIRSLREKFAPKAIAQAPSHLIDELNGRLNSAGVLASAVVGGSFAKGTFIQGDHDVDVFVRFDPSYPDEELSDILASVLDGFVDAVRVHGSRDYFHFRRDGFSFELVPVLKIDDPSLARNVTDVSPLHVAYVLGHIRKSPSIRDDIRLAKLFCKAAKVYGAESYINGFSGHVLDVLVIHYGSLLALLKAAASWPDKVFIDPCSQHDGPSHLDAAKRTGPLVLLDPVQPARNAAAALGKECFDSFRVAARSFLSDPDTSFFEFVALSKDIILKKHPGKPVLVYSLQPLPDASKDVRGTKLLKVHEFLLRQAKDAGFDVLDEGFEFDGLQALAFIFVDSEPLPECFQRLGPPLTAKTDAVRFRKAHGDAVVERDGRLFASLRRDIRTLHELFTACKRDEYVLSRATSAKII